MEEFGPQFSGFIFDLLIISCCLFLFLQDLRLQFLDSALHFFPLSRRKRFQFLSLFSFAGLICFGG